MYLTVSQKFFRCTDVSVSEGGKHQETAENWERFTLRRKVVTFKVTFSESLCKAPCWSLCVLDHLWRAYQDDSDHASLANYEPTNLSFFSIRIHL